MSDENDLIYKVYSGDCVELFSKLKKNSIGAVVTDPPYNLSFMNKKWDKKGTPLEFQKWCEKWGKGLLKVMKPGAWICSFGGTKTYHRLVSGLEDAGFEIKDCLMWVYGTGFPKSYNISKGFDKQAGVDREIIGKDKHSANRKGEYEGWGTGNEGERNITAPATELAKKWDGWGTALKPAYEPIILAQKPREGTYCNNVEKYGVGGLNIDGCRIKSVVYESERRTSTPGGGKKGIFFKDKGEGSAGERHNDKGRFPANLTLDEEAGKLLDEQSGESSSSDSVRRNSRENEKNTMAGKIHKKGGFNTTGYNDSGGASRFFYCAKASKSERTMNGEVDNTHPTVKPLDLVKYLIKLITPEGEIILDPFLGSGSTLLGAYDLGRSCIGSDDDPEAIEITKKRFKILKSEKGGD